MSLSADDHALRKRAALISLSVGVILLAGKWAAYALTDSRAILSDALESIVNVAAAGFAFTSILLGSRPPDPKYPYGYGKIDYFSAGFEGGLILLASCMMIVEGVRGLWEGVVPHQLDLGLLIVVGASVANLVLGRWLVRLGRRTGSLVLEADGHHVLADAYTSFGVVAGVGLVRLTRLPWLDGLVAIVVALNILRTGWRLVRAGITGLMDRADPSLLTRIVVALQGARQGGWVDLHQLRAWQAGDRVFVDFHMVVPPSWSVGQLHEAINACRSAVREALGPACEVQIHFDPDTPHHAEQAPGREAPWTVDSATRVGRRRGMTMSP